ncbi:uncharacterized protein LOC132724571 [Ruditapes philippinarum]|uniref:uncharacterized protein LOC132724571 n=1 Tax=Ruditapes philippinarum TaxID=129788 RepID=UPI00295ADD4C|nr:uncharacterized protein LOC132724571 [Ruditapes philippinarum]
MAGWMNDSWPMQYLIPETRQELADRLDVVSPLGLGYPMFAAALRINNRQAYITRDIELIRVRSQPGSPTLALLLDFEQRGGTLQAVQSALERIGHVASSIIPTYLTTLSMQLENVQASQSRVDNGIYPSTPNSGFQNTEFTPCNCPRCQTQDQSSYERSNTEVSEQSVPRDSAKIESSKATKRVKRKVRTSRSSTGDPSIDSFPPNGRKYVVETLPGETRCPPRVSCDCDECRLRSDPDQTQRFTLESHPKIECVLRNDLMRQSSHNTGHLESGLSQLYLDSDESEDISVESSDETFVKSALTESQSTDRVRESVQNAPLENLAKNGNKLCSRSDNGKHRLGEMPESCPVCRNHVGAIPKDRSKTRNNSITYKNEQQDADLRKSWHGTSKNKPDEMLKSWSDSSLSPTQHFKTNTHKQNHDNPIDETIYSRISQGSSGPRSARSSVGGNDSVHEVYQNNLESAGGVRNNLDDSRNIVPSDSSNSTGVQNQAPAARIRTISSNSNDSASDDNSNATSFNPWVPFSNAESDQHRGRSAMNGQRGPKVFVTYAWNGNTDSDSFIKEVVEMCIALRNVGVRTKIDMDDSSYYALRLNKLDWIERNVREAKYIIVCITPTYRADIEPVPTNSNQASPRTSQLNARYIFDMLRGEYYNNSSQNRRIIPVIFPNHRTTHEHIPTCMRSTLIYEYPNCIAQIIEAILGHGRYRPS